MMWELPEDLRTARGYLSYRTMDTGDRRVVFRIDQEDWDAAKDGEIVGMVIPARADKERLDQLLGELRDLGLRFIVMPRREK
jgi:hypothetical protein